MPANSAQVADSSDSYSANPHFTTASDTTLQLYVDFFSPSIKTCEHCLKLRHEPPSPHPVYYSPPEQIKASLNQARIKNNICTRINEEAVPVHAKRTNADVEV